MKIRNFFVILIGVIACQSPRVWGFQTPERAALPNYDGRKFSPASVLPTSAEQEQAADQLRVNLPGLRLVRDPQMGNLRSLSVARGHLTAPATTAGGGIQTAFGALPTADPNRVIKDFLDEHAVLFGHDAGVLTSARVTREAVAKHNGLRTVVWEQMQDAIPVFESVLVGNITKNGELVSLSDTFVPQVTRAADAGTPNRIALVQKPTISSAQAIALAAANLGGQVDQIAVTVADEANGAEQRQTLRAANLFGPAWAQLVWLPMNRDSLRLCWRVILSAAPRPERYMVLVDAETGEVRLRRCLTKNLKDETYNIFPSDSPSPFSPGWPTPLTNQPPVSNRLSVVINGALDTNASPAGWIFDSDPNNTTKGNNADAFLDRDFDETPDVPQPNGGANRVFNFPLSLALDPLTYQAASTVQLFYQANWYHDRLFQLGFTEAAGNYQTTNFNRGGLGNDSITCLVQAGANLGYSDNAFFSPAPDGIPGMVAMFTWSYPTPNRDGSLDQEIVIHELTHGLSDRLVGGGVGISALQTGGMGEGWSDFYALGLLSQASDNVNSNYAAGAYAIFQLAGLKENYYFGIRRYPYTTDLTKNPLTFKDIDPTQAAAHPGIPINPIFGGGDPSEVHNSGEVWCVALREVWANLVTKLGWTNGNELSLQLVTDGMKLSPENPNFLEARDAILLADEIDTGSSNYEEIWTAFAKRGMGYSATSPSSDTTTGVSEAFDLPPDIVVGLPDGVLEVKVNPPSGAVFFAGDTNSLFVSVRDAIPVTNATILATVNTTNLVFNDAGVPPDVYPRDGNYAAWFIVPSSQPSVTIPIVVSAPEKQTNTNSVTYLIVPHALNDYFTNAIKVPGTGTNYFTSNKGATIETNEPPYAGAPDAAASLWWNFTSPVKTNVLVDTGGSDITTVVAVYTNNTLVSLVPVASAVGASSKSGGRRAAFLNFTANAGTGYRIAVAGLNKGNVGPIRLNIQPGGQADTNGPNLTVTSPLSGIMVTTNQLSVSGNATDPQPNPSGIRRIAITVTPSPGFGEPVTTEVAPVGFLQGPLSTNWTANVVLKPGLNTVNVTAIDFGGNISQPTILQATYRARDPINDLFVNATSLTNSAGTNLINTLKAAKEVGEPNHAGNAGGKSAWWSFTAPADGVLDLSTTNSSFDTLLAVYTGNRVSSLTVVGGNDDAYDGAPNGFSALSQTVRSNQTYHVAVDGYDGVGGVVFLTYSFAPATLFSLTVGNVGPGQVTPGSSDVVSNAPVVLTATANTFFVFESWTGSITSTENPLPIVVKSNLNLTANFRPIVFSDGFETGNLLNLNWTSGGNLPWIVQTNTVLAGSFAARSGAIANNQTSSLILTTNFGGGAASFAFTVSSEPNWDVFSFSVDGVLQQQWSGNIEWTSFAFPVPSGVHTLEWRYNKDASGSAGLDAAFIDNVILPFGVQIDETTPAMLQILRQTNGSLLIQVNGQTNQEYVIQGAASLAPPSSWQNLSTNVATGGVIQYVDPGAGTNPLRFYRAVVPVP